ncbi:hypothetical protein GCM10010446_44840 [Streptomyces enissocaesilis]|uniref:Methyltransferase n=1 Tax=Streptomyces enissocaesilis TaxID=332589 RepID=A0ABP6K1L6_9ACTN
MDDTPSHFPATLSRLRAAACEAGFLMSWEERTGGLSAVPAAAQPGGRMLELGTGVGQGAAWLPSGMDEVSSVVTVQLDPVVPAVAHEQLGADQRVTSATGGGGKNTSMSEYAARPPPTCALNGSRARSVQK